MPNRTVGEAVAGGRPGPAEPTHDWKRHGALYSRVIDTDPVFQKRTVYWYDSDTNEQFVTEDWYGLDQLIEANKAQYNATDERARMTPLRDGGEMQWTKVFTVPMALVPDIMKKTHHGKDRQAVSRWLMDPDNRMFMTRPLRLGV